MLAPKNPGTSSEARNAYKSYEIPIIYYIRWFLHVCVSRGSPVVKGNDSHALCLWLRCSRASTPQLNGCLCLPALMRLPFIFRYSSFLSHRYLRQFMSRNVRLSRISKHVTYPHDHVALFSQFREWQEGGDFEGNSLHFTNDHWARWV